MNDAQTWTVIGGFLAILTVGMGLVLRTVRAEIEVVAAEFRGEFKTMTTKVEHLDRDVQRLVEHTFGIGGK